MKFGNINLQGIGEIQNANIQNLPSAPITNLKKGRFYFNTTDNTLYVYDGTKWVDTLSQGIIYQEGTGIDITNSTISIDTSVVATQDDLDSLANIYINQNEKGANGGIATLDNNGLIPTSQLPSFVDDVIESYIVSGSTPLSAGWLAKTPSGSAFTPETDKIYVILTDGVYLNKTYRWGGTTYVEISSSPAQATESQAGIAEIATQTEVNTGTDDTRIVTPLKLATRINGMVKQYSTTNPALTESGGYCNWVITHNLNTENVGIHLYENTTGDEVMYDRSITSANSITISILSDTDISIDTYTVVVMG